MRILEEIKRGMRSLHSPAPLVVNPSLPPLNEGLAITSLNILLSLMKLSIHGRATSLVPEIALSKSRVSCAGHARTHASYARRGRRERRRREGGEEGGTQGARREIVAGFLGNPRERKTRGRARGVGTEKFDRLSALRGARFPRRAGPPPGTRSRVGRALRYRKDGDDGNDKRRAERRSIRRMYADAR